MPSPYTRPLRAWLAALALCSAAPAAATDYVTAVMDLGPLCYWRLGESSGSIAHDSSGSALNGTYFGGVTLGQPGALIADADTAASFNGSDAYIECPHDNSMCVDSGTIQFWFKQAGSVSEAGLLSKDSKGFDTGGHLTARIDGSALAARLQSASDEHSVSSGPTEAGRWYMVTFTFGAAGMKLYMDDQVADSNAYSGGTGPTSGGTGNYEPIALGANSWASNNLTATPLTEHFSGLIDEVAIFDYALLSGDVEHLHRIATVPEPTVTTLLLAGVLVIIRRRRQEAQMRPPKAPPGGVNLSVEAP